MSHPSREQLRELGRLARALGLSSAEAYGAKYKGVDPDGILRWTYADMERLLEHARKQYEERIPED